MLRSRIDRAVKISLAWEPLAALLDDGLEELVKQQWRDQGLSKGEMPAAINWDDYRANEARGVVRILAARRDDALVGYSSFLVTSARDRAAPRARHFGHLPAHRRGGIHHRSTATAVNDAIFVTKGQRGVLGKLIDRAERDLSAEFAPQPVRIVYHDNFLAPLLSKHRYAEYEVIRDKLVGAGA